MKKILFILLAIPSLVHAGTLTFYQNFGGNLGTIIISTFTGVSSPPGGFGFLEAAHGPYEVFGGSLTYQAAGVTLMDWAGADANGAYVFTNESYAAVPFPVAGTISNLSVVMSGGNLVAYTTVTIRVAGANGNEQVVIPNTTPQTVTDSIHTDSIAAGTTVDFSINSASDGNSGHFNTFTSIAFTFTANTNNVEILDPSNTYNGDIINLPKSGVCMTNGFANNYQGPSGVLQNGIQTESFSAYNMRAQGTFSNLCVYVSSNARPSGGGNWILTFRKNGSNGNETITIPDGASNIGLYCDTTHTDSVVVGDTVTYDLLGDQNNSNAGFCWTFESTAFTTVGNAMDYQAITGGHGFVPGDANIIPIMGGAGYDSSETNDYEMAAQNPGTLSNMCVTLQSGGNLNQIATVNMRKNGSNCGPVVTIPANYAGGTICDNTHTCTVGATDKLDYKETVPAGTGQINWNGIGATFTHS